LLLLQLLKLVLQLFQLLPERFLSYEPRVTFTHCLCAQDVDKNKPITVGVCAMDKKVQFLTGKTGR
jgi:hypothetical protein